MNKKSKRLPSTFDEMEVYRRLRTNIEYSSIDKKMKVINITSTQANEGKTTVSTNLAIACAKQYSRVLLIDCDLRRPQVHKCFNISNSLGLSNLLVSDSNKIHEDIFYKFQEEDNKGQLYILPAGIKVPNALELLASAKFKNLIKTISTMFDFVILDCTPIFPVSDSIPVSSISDGTVVVISSKDTNKKDVKEAITQLQRSGANVIGTVLNKVEDLNENRYYDYYE